MGLRGISSAALVVWLSDGLQRRSFASVNVLGRQAKRRSDDYSSFAQQNLEPIQKGFTDKHPSTVAICQLHATQNDAAQSSHIAPEEAQI